MTNQFYDRLNQIEARISSPEMLRNVGLGNEIGFHIFDYPPEFELEMREHLNKVLARIKTKIAQVDLFELLISYLKKRNILESALDLQRRQSDFEMFRALKGSLDEEKRIAPYIVETINSSEHEIVIVTGVGSVYPLLRTHRLLNCLQPLIKETPLVVFYPGVYSGQSLSLFGRLSNDNYYRAFRLV